MRYDYYSIRDIVFSKDFVSFLKNFDGSVLRLLDFLSTVEVNIFDSSNVKNKKEAYIKLAILSLIPELLQQTERLKSLVETNFEEVENTDFDQLVDNVFQKKLINQALIYLQFSDLDYYDCRVYREDKGKYRKRRVNKELLDEFSKKFYDEDSDSFEEEDKKWFM